MLPRYILHWRFHPPLHLPLLICHEALRHGVLLTSCLDQSACCCCCCCHRQSFGSSPLTRAKRLAQHRHHGTNRRSGRLARPSDHNMDDAPVLLNLHAGLFDMRQRVQWTVVQSYKWWSSDGQYGMLAASIQRSCLADVALCGLGILFSWFGLSRGIHERLYGGLRAKTAMVDAIFFGAVRNCHRLLPNVS